MRARGNRLAARGRAARAAREPALRERRGGVPGSGVASGAHGGRRRGALRACRAGAASAAASQFPQPGRVCGRCWGARGRARGPSGARGGGIRLEGALGALPGVGSRLLGELRSQLHTGRLALARLRADAAAALLSMLPRGRAHCSCRAWPTEFDDAWARGVGDGEKLLPQPQTASRRPRCSGHERCRLRACVGLTRTTANRRRTRNTHIYTRPGSGSRRADGAGSARRGWQLSGAEQRAHRQAAGWGDPEGSYGYGPAQGLSPPWRRQRCCRGWPCRGAR